MSKLSSLKNDAAALSLVFAACAVGLGLVSIPMAKMGLNPLFKDSDGAVAAAQKAGLSNVEATGY